MSTTSTSGSQRTCLGIELGSTRIKACLVDADQPTTVLAAGSQAWENQFVDRMWTYSLDEVWNGIRAAIADLGPIAGMRIDAIGISAMMHGYLPFDSAGELLVPFRTWRNTTTARASEELVSELGVNIPLRWSIAHLHQAVLDDEQHLARLHHITTLAGYVHEKLTGERVLGVGDASGMFPISSGHGTSPDHHLDYDPELVERYDRLAAGRVPPLRDLLPRVLKAGDPAGSLTAEGLRLLDPEGTLSAGVLVEGTPVCPPEGDAGTGMVATHAVAPRTGNVSAGTSIFAMVVLERPLATVHQEIDLVTTPAGDPVAMVHCNNGASELASWAGLFRRFAEVAGLTLDDDAVYDLLFREALAGDPDAGGLLAYNQLAGEPIAGLEEGRPLFVRTPDSSFTLANTVRAQLYGVFSTLALGMHVLTDEGVQLDSLYAHGGMFRTAGVAQRFLAGALDVPVSVGETAAEGGAWGMAVLAAHALAHGGRDLATFLDDQVFADAALVTHDPDPADVAGFAAHLERYRVGLAVEAAAVKAL
ncbi:xylulokinase [Aestuariimicrobium sp. T2.26MG-19.2B]|uniref:xylulokinase n=1 Tax=Aestuariimicrobium sp. T2.26MG-19.2B TaxID=3040679 RepID=UPI0024775480|nr:FGGY-family carbohydrate kinase [Aestuariimicrobium sp. T2.26MG-19.2B]CAI9410781.1 Xylulose kinase [Aestuariimicrobium sp. T2.26MG-19.2B]